MAKQTAKNLPAKQVVSLDNYSEIKESELTALVKKYAPMVVTVETYKDGLSARKEIRDMRYSIQNITKGNKALLNGAKKTLDSRAEKLIAIIQPVEDKIDGRLKEIEAEKERIKKEKEIERQRVQAERMEKIGKIQSEFTTAMVKISTLEQADELKEKLLSFKVTEKEFGDLSLSCKQTISSLEFSINEARERIEKEIEAEKQLKLKIAKSNYLSLNSGEDWDGEDDIEKIISATALIINRHEKAKVIKEYHDLGGEGNIDDTMTLDELIGFLATLKAEVAELARQKREDIKAAEKAKEKLGADRLKILYDTGSEFERIVSILANDHPDKMLEDLTEVEFEAFLGNLIAIKSELDKKKVPVDNPAIEVVKGDGIESPKGSITFKKEPIRGEFKEEATFTKGNWIAKITNSPIGSHVVVTTHKTPASSEEEIKAYGGYLIAESCTPENAKLIAAAPDMLEALFEDKRMYEAIEPAGGWQGVYEAIESAIKKAKK